MAFRKTFTPHADVYVRLGVSKFHGVGVFAICPIPEGTNPFQHDATRMVWVSRKKVEQLTPEIKKLYEDFGVLELRRYGVPTSFNQLTPAWYLNNNTVDPNMRCGDDYEFFAARDIEPGEELTIDYSTYSE